MILTVTMNPSVDIAYPLEQFKLDTVNRAVETYKTPGGKGLNVTRVLSQLGDKVCATGLLGGKIGEFIECELDRASVQHSFYKIAGETRNCIAILHGGSQTEILEQGPTISKEEGDEFLNHFEKLVQESQIVSISGSLPKGMPVETYSRMVAICENHRVPVVLDCSGEAMLAVLNSPHKPTVIKPNSDELQQFLGIEAIDTIADLKAVLQEKLFSGIEWIIVSLGAKGAFAKHRDTFYKVSIPKIDVVNPVGSGDSTVAGITSALSQGLKDKELLKKANVLGMLNAQENLTGCVNLENYDTLVNQIEVVEV